jgi:hypothetical protein
VQNSTTEKHPKPSNRWISQTTWSLETKFWGDDEHRKGKDIPPNISASNFLQVMESQISCLYLKNTKNSKTTKFEGLHMGFEGQDHTEKRHTKSHKETPLKASHENPNKELRKSPKKGKRKKQ